MQFFSASEPHSDSEVFSEASPPTVDSRPDLPAGAEATSGDAAPRVNRHPPWVHFLASVTRLVDAHDCARQVGAPQVIAPSEQRPGLDSGVFPTVAWRLLEWLRDRETEGALDYTDLTPFIDDVAPLFGLTDADVQYIATLLATPTLLRYADRPDADAGTFQVKSTSDTALLDKQRRGHSYRLTRVGREAIGFAGGYFKWIHASAEAQKLLIDLRNGEYLSFRSMAQRLITRIRSESLEVLRAIERPEVEEMRTIYLRDAKKFTATITEVRKVLDEVQNELLRPEVREDIDAWSAGQRTEEAVTVSDMNELVRIAFSALRTLQMRLSSFTVDVQKRDRSLVGLIRFDSIAKSLLMLPDTDIRSAADYLEGLLAGAGPLLPDLVAFAPAQLERTIKIQRRHEKKPPGFRKMGVPVAVMDRLDSFVERNRALLLTMLDEGPVTLTRLMEDEDIDFQDLQYMAEAASLMVSPLIMFHDDPKMRIRIGLGDWTTWTLPDGWEMSGRELIRRYAPPGSAEAGKGKERNR